MTDVEKRVEIGSLLRIYGNLLTEQQQGILASYYLYDLSISEISHLRDISRAAVFDAMKIAEGKLRYYEERLKLLERTKALSDKIGEIALSDDMKERLLELKEEIDDGI